MTDRTSPQPNNKPILYTSYVSDTSWRVRIALEWKGIDYEARYVDIKAQEYLSEEYSKLNPNQKLPCFITKTGKVLTQSLAIIEYLEAMYPERPMLPKSPFHRAEAWSLALDIACDIQPIHARRVLELIDITSDKCDEFAHKIFQLKFEGLEKRLEDISGTYCVADQISVADFCLVPMVFIATKFFKIDMKSFPYITRIRNTLMTLPEFRNTHPYNQADCPSEYKGIIQ
ncbi:Maleylacetoacetate isomerase [Cokeromyces recurvatus]|uniref:Maleylacetoacetate isomerase n=1 Tax=Cokeromyces recurvatus TaxID=90255 RepID=UPI00221FF4E9|nr:Maleylacetoacetate isomerase [Cokeromyces recurvatus]KAI7905660.1 Maleylacetoacetate isomerase [Cokeromyces recurvatus]